MSAKLIKALNGTYFTIDRIHAIVTAEFSPGNWYIAAILIDATNNVLLDGFVTEAAAKDIADEIATAIGVIDPVTFL